MFKLLIPVSVFALVGFVNPTPSYAASDATDISARAKFRVAPVRAVRVNRVNRVAVHRSAIRVNRGFAVRSVGYRGVRGVSATRFAVSRYGYSGRYAARAYSYGGYRYGGLTTAALIGGRYGIYRSPRSIYWGGRYRSYLPLAALGAVAVGGAYYYADAYISAGRPACQGVTPDGCRLNWQMVGFEDGGGDGGYQCVQYCPRPGAAAPARVVSLTDMSSSDSSAASAAAGPATAQGACEITIYSEPRFASAAVPTSDDQPKLSESGWQNQIASLQIKSGTWELFTEEQYNGSAMRLAPGSYPDLEPEWRKKINSFMCVEPTK